MRTLLRRTTGTSQDREGKKTKQQQTQFPKQRKLCLPSSKVLCRPRVRTAHQVRIRKPPADYNETVQDSQQQHIKSTSSESRTREDDKAARPRVEATATRNNKGTSGAMRRSLPVPTRETTRKGRGRLYKATSSTKQYFQAKSIVKDEAAKTVKKRPHQKQESYQEPKEQRDVRCRSRNTGLETYSRPNQGVQDFQQNKTKGPTRLPKRQSRNRL